MTVYTKEYAAAIVDIFEDFLDEKGIEIPNNEKEGDEHEAIIYGEDWEYLMQNVTGIIKKLCININTYNTINTNSEDWEH